MVPSDTDQLYVGVKPGAPPERLTVTVAAVPGVTAEVGQSTVMVGHGGLQSAQAATVTLVVENEIHPQPSSTSTVDV
jgi:hypothetical protein